MINLRLGILLIIGGIISGDDVSNKRDFGEFYNGSPASSCLYAMSPQAGGEGDGAGTYADKGKRSAARLHGIAA